MDTDKNQSHRHHQTALAELKIKAKRGLKSIQGGASPLPAWISACTSTSDDLEQQPQLKTLLTAAARKAGFKDWRQASHYLGGGWQIEEDAGTFWYSPKCRALLNVWCRDYEEAKEQLPDHSGSVLFPYKRQFIIADDNFIKAIGLENHLKDLAWNEINDVAIATGSAAWDELALARIEAIFRM